MAKKGSKALLVIGSFVVIGGVLAYFLFFRNGKRGSEGTGETPPSTGEPSASTPTPSGSTSYSFPFKTTEEGNKFRVWVNNNYPDWAKKNNLDKSGSLNSYVDKAWKEYGATYQKYVLNPAPAPASATSTSSLKKLWSTSANTGLYTSPSSALPYRLAGKYEYVGNSDGKSYFDYYGNPYYKFYFVSGGKTYSGYIKKTYATFTQPQG